MLLAWEGLGLAEHHNALSPLHQNERLAGIRIPADPDCSVLVLCENSDGGEVLALGGLQDLVRVEAEALAYYLRMELDDFSGHAQ